VLDLARADGLAETTLRRAKRRLHVKSIKTGGGPWLWAAPEKEERDG
jgi:hypothetical protein